MLGLDKAAYMKGREHTLCLRASFFKNWLSVWNEAFWIRWYDLNFISVSAEQCLLHWVLCFCPTAWLKVSDRGREGRKREKNGDEQQSHCNTADQLRRGFENMKERNRTVVKDSSVCLPLWSLIFSTAGRVFLRGRADTADVISPFWLPADWGLPQFPSDPSLGLGGLGGGAQEDSELDGVRELWFLSNVRGIW